MTRQRLYAQVEEERRAQDAQWGGAANDDLHSPRDWVALACRHLGLAVDDGRDHDPARWRRQMVRVAALALAAVESQDRLALLPGKVADHTQKGPGY